MEDSEYINYSNFDYHFQSSFDVNYDSDKVDSDIEDILYASVHHQTIDSKELSTKKHFEINSDQHQTIQSTISNAPEIINRKKVLKKKKKKLKCKNGTVADHKIAKVKNNIINGTMDENKVNNVYKCKMVKLKATEFDISYGNNILLENNLEISNPFYSEDSYNSEDNIEDVIRKMPSDKRYWKVLKKDKITRTQKNRIKQCHYCFSPDHFIRNCPNVCISIQIRLFFLIDLFLF